MNGTSCSVPPVVLAAYKGLDRCIQCLLRNGANPNVPDEVSSTFLFLNFNISSKCVFFCLYKWGFCLVVKKMSVKALEAAEEKIGRGTEEEKRC